MRPPPPPPTHKPNGPPKLKNIKQLEKKKRNLKNQIRRNPNNRKAIKQLEGVLKQLGSPPKPKAQPKTTNVLALRKEIVRTGRDPIPLRKHKNSKSKKPKDEIKKVIEHKERYG